VPTAIVSPDGIATELTIDANDHLTWITFADGGQYNFEYTGGGLLTVETDPEQNLFDHSYDDRGRLTEVQDEEEGDWTFSRTYQGKDPRSEVLTGE
jgi:YD repeat-containing protein